MQNNRHDAGGLDVDGPHPYFQPPHRSLESESERHGHGSATALADPPHRIDGRLESAVGRSTLSAPSRTLWKRLGLGKLLRRTIALGCVAFALWWLVVPLLFPLTNEAVVNARLVQVRAPIDGTSTELDCDLGDDVDVDQPMLRLVNRGVDSVHLPTLKTKQAELLARKKRLAVELEQVVAAEAVCRQTCDKYRRQRVSLLESQIKEQTARQEMARHQHLGSEKQLTRIRALSVSRSAADWDVDVTEENEGVARHRIEAEGANLLGLRTELEAAGQGVYLRNETPYFLQRGDELAMRIPQLRAEMQEAENHLAAVTQELEREQLRMAQLTEATARAPVAGVVWARHGNQGQVVKQNETVYEIADTHTLFVEALLPQRYLAKVGPGQRATVILAGGRTLTGRVRAVRPLGSTDEETVFAVKLAGADRKMARVVIDFEDGAADPRLLGRHVRVLLTDEQPNALQRSLTWIFSNLGG